LNWTEKMAKRWGPVVFLSHPASGLTKISFLEHGKDLAAGVSIEVTSDSDSDSNSDSDAPKKK
jgi:hypothetical protein